MKIRVLKAFYHTQTGAQKAKVVIETPDNVAEVLINEGFAEAVKETAPKQTEAKKPKTKKGSE